MAAKLILSMDGLIIKEYTLIKDRMTIGRHVHNDIVIDNLAVSGEHAAVVTILNDSFLEDLDSTNGLEVNGIRIKKHFLQSNDVIEISKYKLKYVNDQMSQGGSGDFEKTMVLRAPVKQPTAPQSPSQNSSQNSSHAAYQNVSQNAPSQVKPTPAAAPQADAAQSAGSGQAAVVQVLTGPNAGKELELVKNLTTLGKPGLQVAVLTRRPHGFFITYVEGEHFPLVNGKALTNQPLQLNEHDVIELAGVKMEFYYKG